MKKLGSMVKKAVLRLNDRRLDDPDVQRAIVRIFVRQAPVNMVMTFIASSLAVVFLLPVVTDQSILSWWACLNGLTVYLLLRRFTYARRRRSGVKDQNVKPKARDYSAALVKACGIAFLSGGLWGLSVVFMPFIPPEQSAFLVIVAGAMAGGATSTLAALPVAAYLYVLAVILPYAAYFFLFAGGGINTGLGMLALVMSGGLIWATRLVHGSVIEEITLRAFNKKLAERFRIERQELADTAFAADAYAVFGPDDRLQYWNSRLTDVLDIPATELKAGAHRRTIMASASPPSGIAPGSPLHDAWIIEQVSLNTEHDCSRHMVRHANGRWITTTARRTDSGSTIVVFSDCTEMRMREDEAAESEGRLKDYAKIAQDELIAVVEPDYEIEQWVCREEIAATALWRSSPVGQPLFEALNGYTDHGEYDVTLARRIKDGEPFRNHLISIPTPQGRRWKQVGGVPHYSLTGGAGFLLAVTDVTDIQEARAEMLEYQGQLRSLSDVSFEVLWELDRDGKVRKVIGPSERIYDPAQIIGRSFASIWNEARLESDADEALPALIQQRQRIRGYEYWKRGPLGEKSSFREAVGLPQYDADRNYTGYLIQTRDISESIRLRTQSKRRDEEIKRLTETLSAGVFRMSKNESDWSVDYVNAWLVSEYGLDDREVEGLLSGRQTALIAPTESDHRLRTIDAHAIAEAPYECRWQLTLPTGEERWILERGRFAKHSDGRVRVDGLMSDVTQTVEYERALLQGRRKLDEMIAVLDAVRDVIAIQSRSGEIVYTNRTARGLLSGGLSVDTRYDNFLDILPIGATEGAELKSELNEALETFGAWEKTIPLATEKGGRVFETRVNKIPDGGAMFLAMDMTANKRFEIEEQRLKAELADAQQMQEIGQLAGGIAHDFANIVSFVRSFADLLAERVTEGTEESIYASKIVKACDRAAELVNQILIFARTSRLSREPIFARDAWQKAVAVTEGLVGEPIKLELENVLDDEVIECGQTGMVQILMNLVVNARDALGKTDGLIKASITRRELTETALTQIMRPPRIQSVLRTVEGRLASGVPYVCLTVEDNGSGIAPDVFGRILDPFFTTKGGQHGTGLGLAVVRNVVARCQGAIQIESELGKGTRFVVYLAVSDMRARQQSGTSSSLTLNSEAKKISRVARVLVVDDEEDLSDVVATALSKAGYDATNTYSADEAWEVFQDDPDAWDVIITDQVMPGMRGTELIDKVKGVKPHLPIILCTAFSETLTKQSALDLGADVFLSKPILIQDLITTVDSFCSSQSIAAE